MFTDKDKIKRLQRKVGHLENCVGELFVARTDMYDRIVALENGTNDNPKAEEVLLELKKLMSDENRAYCKSKAEEIIHDYLSEAGRWEIAKAFISCVRR